MEGSFYTFTSQLHPALLREFANDTHSLICKSHHLWLGILQDQTTSLQ